VEQVNKPIIELVTKPNTPNPLIPQTMKDVAEIFGKIEYRRVASSTSGAISITNGFGIKNLVVVELPIVGRKCIHRLLVPNFTAALSAIEKGGKASSIHRLPNGRWSFGTQAARLKRGGTTLSLHTWGIAVDINWPENPMGQIGHLDPFIVERFKAEDFAWGGDWEHRDDMHFEYFKTRPRRA